MLSVHPAEMAVTPLCASAGTLVWPEEPSPQATTLPSVFKART